MVTAIACVDRNWGISRSGKLLFRIPEDMRFFRETTSSHVIVMGRKALESFPEQKPLKNRINMVITRDKNYRKDNVLVLNSKEETFAFLENFQDEAFVIGGGEIYEMLYPLYNRLLLTKVNMDGDADKFFPNIDCDYSWREVSNSGLKEYEGLEYRFLEYTRR